jgi:hypothetical protein
MQSIYKEPTNYSPQVVFEANGKLSLKGRSLMLDAVSFYEPLIEWAAMLNKQSVNFTIELDYFNTSSSKKLLELLKTLDDNNNIQEFIVYWAYETDDEDTLLKGQIFEERIHNARFLFQELAGV